MRQDAIRRSQEMHSRAVRSGSDTDNSTAAVELKNVRKNAPSAGLLSDISGSLDGDRMLIAALLLMLLREGGDMRLILALAYILL